MTSRRDFIKAMSLLTSGLIIPAGANSALFRSFSDKYGTILPLRKLGKTGEKVTMLGLGGFHVGWTTEKDAQEVIETAMDGGIRFFDTAHGYQKGVSEERYGKYLVPKYRDDVFIMTKSTATSGEKLEEEFELSLKRLNTDHVDLLQIHSVRTPEDVDNRVENGVLDSIVKIKESGKARYIGFTGHQNPYAHLRMLEKLGNDHVFSTSQLPVNVVDYASEHSFVKQVIPQAIEQNLAILAMKSLADGRFFSKKQMIERQVWETETPVIPNYISVKDASFFTWSLPVSVLIAGAENKELLLEKIAFAKEFGKFTEADREALLSKVKMAPDLEKVEYYKNV